MEIWKSSSHTYSPNTEEVVAEKIINIGFKGDFTR